jgi:hypothetical protein
MRSIVLRQPLYDLCGKETDCESRRHRQQRITADEFGEVIGGIVQVAAAPLRNIANIVKGLAATFESSFGFLCESVSPV